MDAEGGGGGGGGRVREGGRERDREKVGREGGWVGRRGEKKHFD